MCRNPPKNLGLASLSEVLPTPPSSNLDSKAYLLCPAFICSLVLVVDPAKVGHYHRDWQSNDQDTAQGADGTKYLPCNCLGHHVSISVGERERSWGGERI